MRHYIVNTLGEYDNDISWVSTEMSPEEVMWDTVIQYTPYRMSITIMEVDTLDVVDDEEGYTPCDVFEEFLRDAPDGETACGITRLALWEMTNTLVKE